MTNSNSRAASTSVPAKELVPAEKPHTAMPQKMSAAVAASRWLPRNAGHSSGSRTRTPSRLRYGSSTATSPPMTGLTAARPMTAVSAKTATASKTLQAAKGRNAVAAHSTIAGTVDRSGCRRRRPGTRSARWRAPAPRSGCRSGINPRRRSSRSPARSAQSTAAQTWRRLGALQTSDRRSPSGRSATRRPRPRAVRRSRWNRNPQAGGLSSRRTKSTRPRSPAKSG